MDFIFLITLQYIKPQFAVDQYFPKHQKYLDKYVIKGNFICCGRKKFPTGEFILCTAKSLKEAQRIVAEDPFDKNQLAVFEIEEYTLTAIDKHFASRTIE